VERRRRGRKGEGGKRKKERMEEGKKKKKLTTGNLLQYYRWDMTDRGLVNWRMREWGRTAFLS